MARSGAGGEQRRQRPPTTAAGDADRVIDAALARIAADGWQRLSLAAVAAEAGLPIVRVYRAFASKQAILCRFLGRIDEVMLAEPPEGEAGERPRDRIFDLLMRRFDALRPYKPALVALGRALAGDPITALCLGARLLRSMRWVFDAADIATDGLSGAIAIRLAGAAYVSTMRIWQDDDTPDLARTMAALDTRLRRIERWLRPLSRPPQDGEPRAA